jgi:hypothetical protein
MNGLPPHICQLLMGHKNPTDALTREAIGRMGGLLWPDDGDQGDKDSPA